MHLCTILLSFLVLLAVAPAQHVYHTICPERCELGQNAYTKATRLCQYPYLKDFCVVSSCTAINANSGFQCASVSPNTLIIRTHDLEAVELVMAYVWDRVASEPNERHLNSHIRYFYGVDIENDRTGTRGETRYVFDLHTAYTTGVLTERTILAHADWHTDVNYGAARYRVYYRRKDDKTELPTSIDLEVHPGTQEPIEATLLAKLIIKVQSLFTSVRVELV